MGAARQPTHPTSRAPTARHRRTTVVLAGRSPADLDTYLHAHPNQSRSTTVITVAVAGPLGLAACRPEQLGNIDEVQVLNDDADHGLSWSLAQLVAFADRTDTPVRWRYPPAHRCPARHRYAVTIIRCPDALAVCLADGCGWDGSDLQAGTCPAGKVPLLDEPRRRS
jgi:hypothetical protein